MQKLAQEASDFVQESLYKVSNKFFDKNTGNFNTVYERPLNRIVSGLIPVAFLANDAYNLSVLCGDTKEESKKEAKERQKQEISRVFTTAYIQLLTLGAFTKLVNTKSWFAPLTSATTVLVSETTSRKRLGKPIFFLNKEKAKEYNKKLEEKEKSEKVKNEQPTAATSIKEQKTDVNPILRSNVLKDNTAESKVFSSFATSFAGKEESKVEEKKTEVSNALNGRYFEKIILDKDADFFYQGRCKVDDYQSDKRIRQFVVTARVKPYKFKKELTVKTYSLSAAELTVILTNGRMSVVPEITCTNDNTKVVFGGIEKMLSAGTHEILDFQLKEGTNTFKLSGSGTITFKYQEGEL